MRTSYTTRILLGALAVLASAAAAHAAGAVDYLSPILAAAGGPGLFLAIGAVAPALEVKARGDSNNLPAVIERIGEAFEEFKAKNDRRLDEIERRANLRRVFDVERDDGRDERKAAVAEYIRRGVTLPELAVKSMSIGSDPDGGYLVSAQMATTINQTLRDSTPVRGVARVVTVESGDAFEEPLDKDAVGATWSGETSEPDDSATPGVVLNRIPLREITTQPKLTQRLLEDSAFDVAGWLSQRIGEDFGLSENAAFTNGNGQNRPRGFTTYDTAATADGSRTWGVLQHVVTGVNGAFAGSHKADKLIELVYALRAPYRNGAAWMMNSTTAMAIRQFKTATEGQYLWTDTQPGGIAQGAAPMLLGFPVVLNEEMPSYTETGALGIAFGNWARAYTVVDRPGITILRDPFTSKPWVKFYTRKRVGGGVVDFNALKFLKFST